MRIGFIGGGRMAEAILFRILEAGVVKPHRIGVGDPNAERRHYLMANYSVAATSNNAAVIAGYDLIILAVKPQDLPAVYATAGGKLRERQTLLSIVAGVPMSTLSDGFGHTAVIRAMPNLPAQIGAGMTVWTHTPAVSAPHRAMAESILTAIGETVYTPDEAVLDLAAALSGSGPAYVFLMLEALTDAGVYIGLPRKWANRLALQAIAEALAHVKPPQPDPATASGLQVLEEAGVRAAMTAAVDAAYRKSIRLGQRQT